MTLCCWTTASADRGVLSCRQPPSAQRKPRQPCLLPRMRPERDTRMPRKQRNCSCRPSWQKYRLQAWSTAAKLRGCSRNRLQTRIQCTHPPAHALLDMHAPAQAAASERCAGQLTAASAAASDAAAAADAAAEAGRGAQAAAEEAREQAAASVASPQALAQAMAAVQQAEKSSAHRVAQAQGYALVKHARARLLRS